MNVDKTILVPINVDVTFIESHKIVTEAVKILESCKKLGVTFDSTLTFKSHANVIKGRASQHFQTMDKLVEQKWGLSPQTLIRLFNQVLIPKFLFAAPIWALITLIPWIAQSTRQSSKHWEYPHPATTASRWGLCDGEGERAYTAYAPHFSF